MTSSLHTSTMCGASISELDDEQWEANTSVDTARGGKDNITPNKETVSESRPGAIPEMTVQMHGAKSTDKEIVRHFQRIAVSAQCPDAVRRSVQTPPSRQVIGESGLLVAGTPSATRPSEPRSSSSPDRIQSPRVGRARRNMQGCATCRIRKKVSLMATIIGSHFSANSDAMMFRCAQDQAIMVIVNHALRCASSAFTGTANPFLWNIACVSHSIPQPSHA